MDIIDNYTTEKENQKFKNYLVKCKDPYSWFAVDIIYHALRAIYYYTSDDEDITLFGKQIEFWLVSNISKAQLMILKHFINIKII